MKYVADALFLSGSWASCNKLSQSVSQSVSQSH